MGNHLIWIITAAVSIAVWAIAGKSSFRRFIVPVTRWFRYKLDFSTSCSILLIFFVVVAFFKGAAFSFDMPDPETVMDSGFWAGLAAIGKECAVAILDGVQKILGIMDGSTEFLNPDQEDYILWWLLSLGIPVLVVSTALSVLIGFVPKPLPRRKEYLIFPQVEEKCILLAENMILAEVNGEKTVRKDRLAIFLRTKKEDLSPEFTTRLKRIGGKTLPYTEPDLLRIHWGLRRKKIRFFFLSAETEQNFSRMQTLLEEAKNDTLFQKPQSVAKKNILKEEQKGVFMQELYLLSEAESAPMLIDHLRKELCYERENEEEKYRRLPVFAHTDLRLLDRYRTVMYDLLQQKPLYETADNKKIRVLILGFGRVGKAFFRAAVSFCSMAGYETSFCIRDQDLDRQWKELLLEYPQCGEGVIFNNGNMNVQSQKVLDLIDRKIDGKEPFTYIVLSLGDDERNIKLASRLVRHYRQKLWGTEEVLVPTICVNLENGIKSDYVSAFFKHDEPTVPLYVFGTDEKTFSENMLINRRLWNAARMLHKGLKQQMDYDFTYWSEYERRSSVASVAHASYHEKAMENYANGVAYNLAYVGCNKKQKHEMIDAEHKRWMHYSCCEGMKGIDVDTALRILKKKGHHVDPVAQLTPCMVDTKDLEQLFAKLYPNAAKKNGTFIERDRFVVSNAGWLKKIIDGEHEDVILKGYEDPM